MRHLFYSTVAALLSSLLASCSGFSKYGIDDRPSIAVNEDLFGIWRSTKDTNKAGYLVLYSTKEAFGYPVGEKRSLEEYLNSDPDLKKDPHTKERIKNAPYTYYVGYINAEKERIRYNNVNTHMSIIAGDTFLNIPYWDTKGTGPFDDDDEGYVFVRFLALNKDRMSIAVVSDASMRNLPNSAAVREKIQRNLNNRNFYKDTIHFYKVKDGDIDPRETIKLYKQGKLTN